MTRVLAVALAAALALAAAASASERRPTLAEIEREVYCPTCETPLAFSNAPVAERMRAFIAERIAAGDTKSEILATLVAEFGEEVLASPPKSGFTLLAWLLPLGGAAVAAVGLGALARRWTRARAAAVVTGQSANGRPPLDPELERRLDEELARFDP